MTHSSVATSKVAVVWSIATLDPCFNSVIAKHPGALQAKSGHGRTHEQGWLCFRKTMGRATYGNLDTPEGIDVIEETLAVLRGSQIENASAPKAVLDAQLHCL